MAWLRSLAMTCEAVDCTRDALVQLMAGSNFPLGRYCWRHGQTALREQTEREYAAAKGLRRGMSAVVTEVP